MTINIYDQTNKPIYKVSAFVFSEADMGESSITCDIYLSADKDPGFSRSWYIEYRGEKFYLSTLQPPAIKDNSTVRYKYSLTFKSEREDLKRYDMLDLVKANEEDLIPDKYSFSFQGDIVQFVDRFNANLKYNLGTRWEMRLAEGVTSESVVVSCQDGVKMWNLLLQVYDLYGIRWYIAPDNGKMVVFVGYKPTEIEHIFEYDPDKTETGERGGLYSIERVNPLSDIYTRMRGVGSTKNLPYRYFKGQSQVESEKQYPADSDYNEIIANNNYPNLMPKCFRDYLKGWNGTALTPETEAYKKGKSDKIAGKFIPMDYVVSDKESKWGVKYGSLQANDEIFPTIQGVWDDTLGRLDEIVAVSEVKDDNPGESESSESSGVLLCDNIYAKKLNIHRGKNYGTYQSASFTLKEESTIKMIVSASWIDTNNVDVSYADGSAVLPVDVQSVDIISSDGLTTYNVASDMTNPAGDLLFKGPIPAGDYYVQVKCSSKIYNTEEYQYNSFLTVSNIVAYKYSAFSEDLTVDSEDSRIFYIWIKDVGFDIREPQYWALDQGDMAVMFSDGWLAGEDYEFTIAAEKSDNKYTKIYVAEDTSKSIKTTNEKGEPITVQSKWKIGLIRSDAEFEASGKYLPNTVVNAKPGDHFFFVNIQMPQQYVEWAEERVQSYIETELSKVDDEYPTFTIKPSAIFCNEFSEAEKLKAGARIRIRNQRLIGDGYLVVYISSLTLTHSNEKILPTWDVVVSETPSAGQNAISLLQGQVQQLSQNVYSSQTALAEAVAQMDRIFVRGDGLADTSYSPTTFARTVTMNGEVRHGDRVISTDFKQAGFAGNGWGFFKDANGKYCLEIDKVNVRAELNVNQATVNQIEFLSGKTIYSRGGIEVSEVQELPDGYKLLFDTKNGDRMNPFQVNDLAYSQNFNNPDGNIIKYYWAVVTDVDTDYIVISKTQKDGLGVPTQGDNVAQLGNTKDANRQSAFIIDQTEGGMNVQYNRLGDASAPGGMWSFQERATVGFGYDAEDGKAKFFCYGDAYIGNRDLSKKQYVTYQQKEGDTEPKLYVAGSILVGEGSEGLGNLSEWAEKQEQIDNAQSTANNAQNAAGQAQKTAESAVSGVESLKNFTDDAFADGIVNRAESAAIEKYINSVSETKDSVDAAYTTVYNNTLLGGSAKSNLQAAKSTFDTAVADLLASIQTAADDGIATPEEKADVDSKYSTFNVAYSGFSTAIEEAQKYIQTAINATAQGAYQLSQELQGVVNNLNEAIIPDLQAQIDKQIVSYNGDEVPTLDNYPANEWTDDTERNRHINDYYDRKITGAGGDVTYERYKFSQESGEYKWIRIADSGAAQAQAQALEALGVANGKNKVYFGDSTPSVPYRINDVWIKTDGVIYLSNAERGEGATGSISDWQMVNDSQLRLRQMSSDGVISKEEKATLRNQLAQMQKEYESYQSDANTYGVSITSLQTAYNNLTTYLTGTVAVNNDTDTTLSTSQRTTYNTYFANYDAEVSRFTNLVADAIAQGKVNGIEIGGVNLIDGTKDFEGFTKGNWQRTDETINGAVVYKITGKGTGIYKAISVVAGKKYTFSCWYKSVGDDTLTARWFSTSVSTGAGEITPASGTIPVTPEWTRFSVTIDAVKSGYVYLRVENAVAATNTLYVAAYQLEEGTKVTAWKESPNDIQTAIDAAKQAGEEAQAQLNKWASDNYISPTEKTALKQQQADIQSEYNELIAQAQQYNVSTDGYTIAYNNANAALTKYTASSPTDIPVGSDYSDISFYYVARQKMLELIHNALYDKQSDTEYLKEIFQKGETTIAPGVILTNAVAVKEPNSDQVVAMMNGSRNFYDTTHKTAMHVLGIKDGVQNWKNAPTILYEDGFIKAQNAEVGILKVNPGSVEVAGDDNNTIILRSQNITSVKDAIGSAVSTPSVSTSALNVSASTSNPVIIKDTKSSTFNITGDTVMTCTITNSVSASGTGSAKLTVEAVPTDGVSPSILIYSRGASTQSESGQKTDTIKKLLTKGSYNIVVTATCSRSPDPLVTGGGSVVVNAVQYAFAASTRRNLIAPNGIAIVQGTDNYAVFTGDIFEVRMGLGGFRMNFMGDWQKYDSETGAWKTVVLN